MNSQPSPNRRYLALILAALALAAAFMFQQLLLGKPLVRDDAALFVYPQFHAMAMALKAGHLYLWDPQQWCGLPALATGQSGGLYPLHLLVMRVLPWIAGLHVCYWLHLALALLGMVWVARNLGIGWKAGIIGGTLYAFSGYSAAHLVHYNFIAAAAHLPLALAVLQTALRRNQWHWWGLLGLEMALAYWVSHPQIFLMIVAVCGVWLVAGEWWKTFAEASPNGAPGYHPARRSFRSSQADVEGASAANGGPDDIRPLQTAGAETARPLRSILPGLIAAIVVAALLMMPQLLPTLELARESRGVYAGETMETRSFIASYPFRAIDVPRVVLPDLFGTAEANVIGGGPAFHETCAFVGIGGLLLGLVGLIAGWGRRGWWFAVLLLALGASLVPAGNPIYLLVAKIPFLSSFRAMGRWAIVGIAGLSLLVSLGLDALPQASERRRTLCAKVTGLLAGLLLFALVVLWVTFGAEGGSLTLPGQPGKAIAVTNMASAMYNSLIGWEPVLFVLAAVLALVATHLVAKKSRFGLLLAALAIVVPLWYFWQVTNRPGPRDYYQTQPATAIAAISGGGRCTTLPPALVMSDDSWRQGANGQDVEKMLLTPAFGTVYPRLSYAEGYKQGLVTPATLRFWNDYYRYGVQAFTGQSTSTGETIERVGTPVERMKRFHRIVGVGAIVTPGAIADPDLYPVPGLAPVKVYQYRRPPAQVWLVGRAMAEADPEAQLLKVKGRSFDPAKTAVVDQPVAWLTGVAEGTAVVQRQEGAVLEAKVEAAQPSLLVISQAWYPGWQAYVDGKPAPLLRADFAIKAVPVPAGSHVVTLGYQNQTWARGLWLGLAGLVLLMGTVLSSVGRGLVPRRGPDASPVRLAAHAAPPGDATGGDHAD
jgi:hypothetical protein